MNLNKPFDDGTTSSVSPLADYSLIFRGDYDLLRELEVVTDGKIILMAVVPPEEFSAINNTVRTTRDNPCNRNERTSAINVLFEIVVELEKRKERPAGDAAIRMLVNTWENKMFLRFGAKRENYLLQVQQQKDLLVGTFPFNITRIPVEALRDCLRVCVVLGSSDAAKDCIGRYEQLTEALMTTLHRHEHHRIPSITLVRMISGILQTIELLQQRVNGLLQILSIDIGEARVDALFKLLSLSQLHLVETEMLLPLNMDTSISLQSVDITFSLEKLDRALVHSILVKSLSTCSLSDNNIIEGRKKAKLEEEE